MVAREYDIAKRKIEKSTNQLKRKRQSKENNMNDSINHKRLRT